MKKRIEKFLFSELSEEHFDGAPETEESDGVYQFFISGKRIYLRNKETGEITVERFGG